MTLVGGALATWPRATRAQKGIKPAYIGFISGLDNAGAASFISAFREGLTARGYVEPGTLKIEALFADSALDKILLHLSENSSGGGSILLLHMLQRPKAL